MKTVLPARDNPVTPSRNPRPRENASAMLAALLRASLKRSVKADKAGSGGFELNPCRTFNHETGKR
jgi:hypothetical protein